MFYSILYNDKIIMVSINTSSKYKCIGCVCSKYVTDRWAQSKHFGSFSKVEDINLCGTLVNLSLSFNSSTKFKLSLILS